MAPPLARARAGPSFTCAAAAAAAAWGRAVDLPTIVRVSCARVDDDVCDCTGDSGDETPPNRGATTHHTLVRVVHVREDLRRAGRAGAA